MSDLAAAQLAALDGLLGALALEPLGEDRFRARAEPGPFDRTFGGQLVAQALVAAGRTAPGRVPSSLHACFAAAGDSSAPVELDVRRVRDGRSMATRSVELRQGGAVVLPLLASFVTGEPTVPGEAGGATPEVPLLQDWAPAGSTWIDRPPPIELRIGEPTVFLGGRHADGPRTHWMRAAGPIGDEALVHAALLAYASDFLLLDVAFRSHAEQFATGRVSGASLDHAVWFHRPVRFDRWHRCTQETVALDGERALVRGSIADEDGQLVASVAQEVLVRVLPA